MAIILWLPQHFMLVWRDLPRMFISSVGWIRIAFLYNCLHQQTGSAKACRVVIGRRSRDPRFGQMAYWNVAQRAVNGAGWRTVDDLMGGDTEMAWKQLRDEASTVVERERDTGSGGRLEETHCFFRCNVACLLSKLTAFPMGWHGPFSRAVINTAHMWAYVCKDKREIRWTYELLIFILFQSI